MPETVQQELFTAAKTGDAEGVTRALADGADIDGVDDRGWTAVMWAAYRHHFDIIKLLKPAGANLAIRDRLSHDAKDIALYGLYKWGLNTDATYAIRKFIKHDEGYQAKQEEYSAQAYTLAVSLKKLLKGQIQSANVVPHRDWYVEGKYNEMRCVCWVYAGGFDLWIQNFHYEPIVLCCNLEHQDNHQRSSERSLMPIPELFASYCTAYTENNNAAVHQGTQGFVNEEQTRKDIISLGLGRYESLTIRSRQIRLWNSSEDMTLIERRLRLLSTLFRHNSQPVPKPFIFPEYRVKLERKTRSRSGLPSTHYFGGQRDHTVTCPTCQETIQPLARLNCRDPILRVLPWPRPTFDVFFCANCSLFAGPTWVDHSTEAPRILQQDDAADMGENLEPQTETFFSLVPLKRKLRQQSKIGGAPTWIQSDEVPDCCRCQKAMQFVAQFSSTSTLSVTDEVMFYVFVCTACTVSACVVQSH